MVEGAKAPDGFAQVTATTPAAQRDVARPSALLADLVLVALGDGPCHGYELAQSLGDWQLANNGHLYRLLRRMEATGLVDSEWEPSQTGPSRRTYSLTPSGQEALRQCIAALAQLSSDLDHYTARYQARRRRQRRAAGTTPR